MEQQKKNQERARKYGGSSSFEDRAEPSRAPRQDEQGKEWVGSPGRGQPPAYNRDDEQGVSNRPANTEHAFPESTGTETEPDVRESVETTPKQQGGGRGRV